MQSLKISELTPHPKNDYFFDDIKGEKWTEFVNSIRESGVRTPIIVTDKMVIVSGNQRVRACKELGITVIDAEVKHYATEDEVIKDLIETNIRQRGVISDSEVKAGRRFAELQRIAGIRNGGDRKSEVKVSPLKSQDDLANEFGVSKDTMKQLIRISKAEPAVQDLLESGKIAKSTALNIIKSLSPSEQQEIASTLSNTQDRATGEEVQRLIDDIRSKDQKIRELENRPPEVREVIKAPADYEEIKRKAEMSEIHERDFKRQHQLYKELADKLHKTETELEKFTKKANEPEQQNRDRIKRDVYSLCAGISNFLDHYGGCVFMADDFSNMTEQERKVLEQGISALYRWADEMRNLNVGEVME